jgi:hypothetical protein
MYNQNKNIGEQLRHLDELPQGIHMDSASVWNKIEDHLQPRKNNKLPWLRSAAVFVLVICGIIIYTFQDVSSNERSTGTAVATDGDIQKTRPIVPKTEEPVNTEKSISIKPTRPKQQPAIVTSQVPLPGSDSTIVTVSPVINIPLAETGITTIPVNQNTSINTAPVTTNATVKKPRLRIVHLNDLYKSDPVEIAKAETKKQQAAEEVSETEPANVPPPKPFWRSKAPIRIAISLTDNQ